MIMRLISLLPTAALMGAGASLLFLTPLPSRAETYEPNIGYLYPAGGQQGTTLEILAGGQRLRDAKAVYVTGTGVTATVVKYYRPVRNLNGDQRKALTRILTERTRELTPPSERMGRGGFRNGKKTGLRKKSDAEKSGKKQNALKATVPAPKKSAEKGQPDTKAKADQKGKKPPVDPGKLPDHPLLENLDNLSLREMVVIRRELLQRQKKQINTQIGDRLLLRVKIAANAAPGARELRVATSQGLSNPLRFEIGNLPEYCEDEPNEPDLLKPLTPPAPIRMPVVINGQVLPGDVDRIRFHGVRGQSVVLEAGARRLIPYLADAVPGWFQLVATLYDPEGKEIAYADDFRYHPDPVLRFEMPTDGIYELEIRDSIYRGRDDFVYRVRLGGMPVLTDVFPLGGQLGKPSAVALGGWNLPARRVKLNTRKDAGGPVRYLHLQRGKLLSNAHPYAVGDVPECMENEPNDSPEKAQSLVLPQCVNGHINRPGDVDVFRIDGQAGDEIVAEVTARRLGSPLDSALRLMAPDGSVVAWNDDQMEKDGHLHLGDGLITHHADASLMARLPVDGSYRLYLSDTTRQGGSTFSYRLRVSSPRPDFAVRSVPSAITALAGGHVLVEFFIDRKDGFNGPVNVELLDAPEGFRLHGATIPPGKSRIKATLWAPPRKPLAPFTLQMVARAKSDGRVLERPVAAADNRMQAFLWRHLVPAEECMVFTRWPRGKRPFMDLASKAPTKLSRGGIAFIKIRTPAAERLQRLDLKLHAAPKGVALAGTKAVQGGLQLRLTATADVVPGADNLIVEVSTMIQGKKRNGKVPPPRRISVGYLPPLPVFIE